MMGIEKIMSGSQVPYNPEFGSFIKTKLSSPDVKQLSASDQKNLRDYLMQAKTEKGKTVPQTGKTQAGNTAKRPLHNSFNYLSY